MARQKLFDKPLTAAQRQQRRRERVKTAIADQPDELKLRQDFYRWLELYLVTRPELRQDIRKVKHSIEAVMSMVWIADYCCKEGDHDRAAQWLHDVLYCPDELYAEEGRDPIPHSSLFFDAWKEKNNGSESTAV